jgi:small-conductance mechanosensitive channel
MTANPASGNLRIDPQNLATRLDDYWLTIRSWVEGNALELAISVVAATLLFLLLSWLKRVAARIARESEHRAELKSIIARTLARTSKFFRIMVAVELVNRYANAPDMIARTLDVLFTIAVVFQVAIWLREIILGLIERRASAAQHEHDTLQSAMVLIRVLVSFALFAIAAIVVLDNLGVNVTGLIAGLGVGGIAIGLAAQGIFSDLFAAISIIFDKPFRRGEVISYDQTTAKVEKIGMKSTKLRALTGEAKVISNSKLLEKEITNNTTLHYRRTTWLFNIAMNMSTEKLRQVPSLLEAAVRAHSGHFIRAGFVNFGASSYDYQLVFDIEDHDYEVVFSSRHAIAMAIIESLREQQIDLAYPSTTNFTAAPDGSLIMPYAQPTTIKVEQV